MIWIWPIVGALIGMLNALALSVTVQRLDGDRPATSYGLLIAGMAGRWVVTAVLLAVVFKNGINAGLLALAGFWIARWAAILWWNGKG